jgi:two-component system nitrogen regulation sensor histidine kinase NtrY
MFPKNFWVLVSQYALNAFKTRQISFFVLLATLICVGVTWWMLSRVGHFSATHDVVLNLLSLLLGLFLLLGGIFGVRLLLLWLRRRGFAGSTLHLRLAVTFSLLTVTPAILLTLFAAGFFYFGIQGWFSERVSTAVEESLVVAESYLKEHQQAIRADALAMANDLNRQAAELMDYPTNMTSVLTAQALLRNLTEAVVFDRSGKVIAHSGLTFSMEFETISDDSLEKAQRGEVAIVTSQTDDRVRALIKLDQFINSYLYVGRFVDADVLNHLDAARGASSEYASLKSSATRVMTVLTLIFLMAALLLLLIALRLAFGFADWLASPISELIGAAERIRAGDLAARVDESGRLDELVNLSRSFNRMASQLDQQRRDLVDVNRQLETRRQFIEGVLTGVSTGVFSVNKYDTIILANPSASDIFMRKPEDLCGMRLIALIPEAEELLDKVRRFPTRLANAQVTIMRPRGRATLLLRIGAEIDAVTKDINGYIVTCDDITDLMSAQRQAAWADVAKRIAHEIKNPLTPIQLAAERLRRKFSHQITVDPEIFETCTETIIRQVGDIDRMVDEFSSFARMPQAIFLPEDLVGLAKQVIFLQQQVGEGIRIDFATSSPRLVIALDRRQITQAMTNILKNAREAIESKQNQTGAESGEKALNGKIMVEIQQDRDMVHIIITDNGIGLPTEDRHRLIEPYVTKREKGTGLGLAIVKKIMEDHSGSLDLNDAEGGGSKVTLSLSALLDSGNTDRDTQGAGPGDR